MEQLNLLGLNVRLEDSVKAVDNSLPIALKLPKSIFQCIEEQRIHFFKKRNPSCLKAAMSSKQDKGRDRGDKDRQRESSRNRDALRDRDSDRDRRCDKERSRYIQMRRPSTDVPDRQTESRDRHRYNERCRNIDSDCSRERDRDRGSDRAMQYFERQ